MLSIHSTVARPSEEYLACDSHRGGVLGLAAFDAVDAAGEVGHGRAGTDPGICNGGGPTPTIFNLVFVV